MIAILHRMWYTEIQGGDIVIRSEVWAVEYTRVADFFCIQEDVLRTAAGFQYHRCRILVEQLPYRKMGALTFPQTRIVFEGEETDLKAIYHRFFMRFVSAGG